MTSKPNPFDEIERMFDRMSRQFEALNPAELAGSFGAIAVDLVDEGDQYVLTADLPGYENDDIDVQLPDATTLRINADSEEAVESEADLEEGIFIRQERTRSSVSRTVSLPDRVAEADTEATYQNGVLTVTLPKAEMADDEGQHIPVS